MKVKGLRQVAQLATDLDASVRFYGDVLGLPLMGRFDPPGLALLDLGNDTRLLLEPGASPSTLYLAVGDLDAACAELADGGVVIESGPNMVHQDADGLFGPAGGEEWMAFIRDPAGNLVWLVERR